MNFEKLKRKIAKYIDAILAASATSVFFIDACTSSVGHPILHPLLRVIGMLCILVYWLYYSEFEKRRAEKEKAEIKKMRREMREKEFYEAYADYRRDRESRKKLS